MTSDNSLSHSARLQQFVLTTIKMTVFKGGLIGVFKMFKGFHNITFNYLFQLTTTKLRGH